MEIKKGQIISVEGVEGAGKSTQLTFIEDYLKQAGLTLTVTREPGGTPLGEEIREILLKPRDDGMDGKTEFTKDGGKERRLEHRRLSWTTPVHDFLLHGGVTLKVYLSWCVVFIAFVCARACLGGQTGCHREN